MADRGGHARNEPRLDRRRLDRRLERLLFAVAFLSYAYFMQGGSWNHNTRFDTARALVEQRTLQIDSYRHNTGDIAFFDGHYYSDKAPLAGVLAAIPYSVVHAARPLLPEDWQVDTVFYRIASYIVTLLTSGLAAAVTTLLLFRFVRRQGGTPQAAVGVAAVYGVGSYAFPFATVLFGHDVAAAFLFASFYLAAQDGGWKRYYGAGFLGALALLSEYPTIGVSVIIFGYLVWRYGRAGIRRVLIPYALGTILPALLGAVYAWICFGSPLAIGYRHLAPGEFAPMSQMQLLGVSYPHPIVIVQLLFGPLRGLFIGAPVLAMCALGIILGLPKRAKQPAWLWPCGLACMFYVLFVSSYHWWDGGASFGPRHLIPMLPFLCLGGITVIGRWPRVFAALGVVSALVMLAGTGQTPIPAESTTVFGSLYRVYLGHVPEADVLGILRHRESTNVGILADLDASWSLLPVVIGWVGFGYLLWRQTRLAVRADASTASPAGPPTPAVAAVKPPARARR